MRDGPPDVIGDSLTWLAEAFEVLVPEILEQDGWSR